MFHITYFPHSSSTDNIAGISSGWSDVGLSEDGIEKANVLRETLKDQPFDAVFCSDLKRAFDTANILFSERNIPIISDTRLRECNYGTFNGQSSEIVEPMQEKMISERFPEGESYEDVKARLADFLQFLRENYDGKRIAIVAHKAPQLALDVLLKGKTWEQAFAEDWRKTKAWQPGWEYTSQ